MERAHGRCQLPSTATRTSGHWEELHRGRGDQTPTEGPRLLAGRAGGAARRPRTEAVAGLHHAALIDFCWFGIWDENCAEDSSVDDLKIYFFTVSPCLSPVFGRFLLVRTDAGDGRTITCSDMWGMPRFDSDGSSDESSREEDLHDLLHRPF